MHQQQALEEPELPNGKVGGEHGLCALLPCETNPDVCREKHGHIVGAVPDGERDGALSCSVCITRTLARVTSEGAAS